MEEDHFIFSNCVTLNKHTYLVVYVDNIEMTIKVSIWGIKTGHISEFLTKDLGLK